MKRCAVFFATLLSALSLLGGELEEILALRPVFPNRTLQQQLEESLNDRAERIGVWETAQVAWVAQVAAFMELEITRPILDGDNQSIGTITLIDFDDSGNPIYESTENVSASISTQAKSLNRGPLGLTGSTERVAVWDGGTAL